jgi:hypothetical protein
MAAPTPAAATPEFAPSSEGVMRDNLCRINGAHHRRYPASRIGFDSPYYVETDSVRIGNSALHAPPFGRSPLRVSRSVKVLPGIRLNFGKYGISI